MALERKKSKESKTLDKIVIENSVQKIQKSDKIQSQQY